MKKLIMTAFIAVIAVSAFAQDWMTLTPFALHSYGSKNSTSDWRVGLQFTQAKVGPVRAGFLMGTNTTGAMPLYFGVGGYVDMVSMLSKKPNKSGFEAGPAFGYTGQYEDLKHLGKNSQYGLGFVAKYTLKF